MENIRQRSKSELKKLYTNLRNKGITDDMMSDLIEACYNENPNMRTSGFETAGGADAIITFDEGTRTFTIAPFDPEVENWTPRYGIYTWAEKPVYHRIFDTYQIQIPNTEGLYLLYFDIDSETRLPELVYLHNPTEDEVKEIYLTRVIVTWLYWDATNGEALYFGDERHGSEWNPQIQWWAHTVFNALWKGGLDATNVVIGDGSSNLHAQAGIAEGAFAHEDMEHAIAAVASTTGMPVMWFSGVSKLPRIELNAGYMFLRDTFLYYNDQTLGTKAQCTDKYFMLYHVFATNCLIHPVISVMGLQQYAVKNDCCKAALAEVKEIKAIMPQDTALAICSFAFEVNSDFTNDVKCRIVQPCTGQNLFIWIEEITNWYDILILINGGGIAEVLTEMSVTGDGTTEDKIHLVNDEETPDADSYYGTEGTGAKGYHPLPTEAVQELTGATPTFDVDGGRGAIITLSDDTTITFSNLKANDTGHIQVTQDGTGGWELHFAGADIEIALNSYQAAAQVKLTGMAGSKDIVVYWYTGAIMNLAVIFNVQP